MGTSAINARLQDTLVGLKIQEIISREHGNAEIKLEDGPTLFLSALPINGGTLEASVVETDGTSPEWIEAYYGWSAEDKPAKD